MQDANKIKRKKYNRLGFQFFSLLRNRLENERKEVIL